MAENFLEKMLRALAAGAGTGLSAYGQDMIERQRQAEYDEMVRARMEEQDRLIMDRERTKRSWDRSDTQEDRFYDWWMSKYADDRAHRQANERDRLRHGYDMDEIDRRGELGGYGGGGGPGGGMTPNQITSKLPGLMEDVMGKVNTTPAPRWQIEDGKKQAMLDQDGVQQFIARDTRSPGLVDPGFVEDALAINPGLSSEVERWLLQSGFSGPAAADSLRANYGAQVDSLRAAQEAEEQAEAQALIDLMMQEYDRYDPATGQMIDEKRLWPDKKVMLQEAVQALRDQGKVKDNQVSETLLKKMLEKQFREQVPPPVMPGAAAAESTGAGGGIEGSLQMIDALLRR